MSFSTSSDPSIQTRAHALPATLLPGLLQQLAAEREACDSAERRALLLHEEGWIKGLLGDVDAAISDQLEAARLIQGFTEPLLVALGLSEEWLPEQIGTILTELEGAEISNETRTQVLLYVALRALAEGDTGASQAALNRAFENNATEPTTWLLFELLAAQKADEQLTEQALSMQAEQAHDPTWRALFQIDAALASEQLGSMEAALASLRSAVEPASDARWPALLALERLGQEHGRDAVKAEALERQAAFIQEALSHPELSARPPAAVCHPHHATYLWLKAALCQRVLGQPSLAAPLLRRAMEAFSEHPGVHALALAEAGLEGDAETCQRIAQQLLTLDGVPAEKAAWWLHIAASALQQKDNQGALAAAENASQADPDCLLAEALKLELKSQNSNATVLVSLYERAAQSATSDAAGNRALWNAAELSARVVGDVARARDLFSQASPDSVNTPLTLRIQRFLAASVGDAEWFRASTEKLERLPDPGDPTQLGFEALRRRALAGPTQLSGAEGPEVQQALSAWLAAYGPHATAGDPEQASQALELVASFEPDPDRRHSFMVAAALRACLAGKLELAARALTAAEEFGYREPVASLMLAQVHQQRGDWGAAAGLLRQLALGSHDLYQAAALLLQSGLCSWHNSDRAAALSAFESASEISQAPALPLLGWALRIGDPDNAEARRKALDAAVPSEARALSLLERFTLEALTPAAETPTDEALERFVASAPQELHSTASLAQALWRNSNQSPLSTKLGAFDQLEDWGEQATTIARAAAYYATLTSEKVTAQDRMEAAERWVQCDPTLLPALESLLAAHQGQDLLSETRARQTLATRLHGSARAAFESSSSLMSFLLAEDGMPQLAGSDTGSRLAALELAPPGSDPRRRARALAHATELFGEESKGLITALAGYNLLAEGQFESAERAFQVAAAETPEDVFVWEGLRAVAEATKNRGLLAEAYAGLGDSVVDATQGGLYWEKAAFILLDELNEAELGEHALVRTVARDVTRFRCFDRLFRIVRERKDHPHLLALIGARLEATDDVEELAKLFWERARALRTLQQLPAALTALESVQMLEPDHVGALALSGEIFMSQGDFSKAAEQLARLASLESAPAQQRLMSGVTAVDIYENKLGDTPQALSVLIQLYRSGLSTLPVRERLARAAAGAEAWEQALDVLEVLSKERESTAGRAEAARLCLVICRDKLGEKERAVQAALGLLGLEPADPEALELLLTGDATGEPIRTLLMGSREPLVDLVLRDPLHAPHVKLLARLAGALDDAPLRQVALGTLTALGEGDTARNQELRELDQRVVATPRLAIDAESIPDLLDPGDTGALPHLLGAAALSYAELLGPTLQSFGIGKKHRVDPRHGLPIRNEIAAWAGALGLGEFELYVGGGEPDAVRGLVGEPPSLLIGTSVVSPLSPAHRQAVARELFALKRGTTLLRYREPAEIAALIAATCQVIGVNLETPPYAMTAEFARLLSKGLSRRAKKALPPWANEVAASRQEPLEWIEAALSSMDRVASLAAGDVSWVAAHAESARGRRITAPKERERLSRLLGFVLSPTYLELRAELGLAVQ